MTHLTIEPSILYVGTPVELISTDNGDGTFNLAPMSSAWALGEVVVLGIGTEGQTAHNLRQRPELVINFFVVEARVVRVHADPRIVVPGTSYVDPRRWSPLIYNFRHYFGLGEQLGESFRTETPTAARERCAADRVPQR